MYVARLIVVLLLILAILVSVSPQAREKVKETWENIRPSVVAFMDSVYGAIRNLIAGNDSDHKFETPTPISPGVNFDRIITMNYGFSL